MAIHLGVGNMNGIIASNLYLSTEAPRYILGRTSIQLPFVVSFHRKALQCVSFRRLGYHVHQHRARHSTSHRDTVPMYQQAKRRRS